MVDEAEIKSARTPEAIRDKSRWTAIIDAIGTPLNFYSLVVLVSEAIMATAIPFASDVRPILVAGMLGILGVLIVIVFVSAFIRPEALRGLSTKADDDARVAVKTIPRQEMRREIRAEIDEAFERIDVKLRDDNFALFLEAKTGKSETGYENYPGMFEDGANLQVKAVQDKIAAVISAERRGHKDYNLAITPEEIDRIERRLDAIRIALPTDMFRGVFWTFRPMTESKCRTKATAGHNI